MHTPDPRTFAYRVDANDRIEWVSDTFRAFARENGAPDLPDKVLGTPLWDHIAGQETREIYRALIARARMSMHPARVPFRCDAPGRARAMAITLIALPDRSVEIRCAESWSVTREPVPLVDATMPRSDELLTMCSWCKRVKLRDEWIETDIAVARLDLLVRPRMPQLTHGICPECAKQLMSLATPSVARDETTAV